MENRSLAAARSPVIDVGWKLYLRLSFDRGEAGDRQRAQARRQLFLADRLQLSDRLRGARVGGDLGAGREEQRPSLGDGQDLSRGDCTRRRGGDAAGRAGREVLNGAGGEVVEVRICGRERAIAGRGQRVAARANVESVSAGEVAEPESLGRAAQSDAAADDWPAGRITDVAADRERAA